jgi:hypothetical protein
LAAGLLIKHLFDITQVTEKKPGQQLYAINARAKTIRYLSAQSINEMSKSSLSVTVDGQKIPYS